MASRRFELLVNKVCDDRLKKYLAMIDMTRYANVIIESVKKGFISQILVDIARILSWEYAHFMGESSEKALRDSFYHRFRTDEYIEGFENKYKAYCQSEHESFLRIADYFQEIYNIYYEKRAQIETVFGCEYGNIVNIESGHGDMHHGKSVSVVSFENGILIFKPRNELNMVFLQSILEYLANKIGVYSFYRLKYFMGEDYVFEQMVEYEAVNGEEDAREYYYKSGVLLAIFYFLNAFDFHHENVICCKNTPVIIDCETIIRCNFDDETDLDIKDVRNSVLNTSFIPCVTSESVFDINISGIFSEKGTVGRKQQLLIQDDDGGVYYKDVDVLVNPNKNSITNDGIKAISDNDACEMLIEGFTDAGNYINQNKDELKKIITKFLDEHILKCRQLLRSTQVYTQFITASRHPSVLAGEENEQKVFRPLLKNFTATKHGFVRVQHEIEEMKKGNIPLFYARSNSRHLYSGEEVICENYFKETPQELIIKRIDAFSTDILLYQVNLIRQSIASIQKDHDFGRVTLKNRELNTEIDNTYLNACTKHWIDYIEKMAFKTGADTSTLSCLCISKKNRLFCFDNMGISLYEYGLIPLYSVYYGRINNEEDICLLSERFVKGLMHYYKRDIMVPKSRRKYNNSVFTGLGGMIYLAYNFYLVTNKDEYYEMALEVANYILESVIIEEKIPSEEYGFLDGIVSSVFIITKIHNKDKGFCDRRIIEKTITKIVESFCLEKFDNIGFAHGLSGMAFMFAEFFKFKKTNALLHYINEMERIIWSVVNGDDWEDGDDYTWCNGRIGVLLSYAKLYVMIGDKIPEINMDRFIVYYEWIKDKACFEIDNYCLCHGVFGNIEVADYCAELLGDTNTCTKTNAKYFDRFSDIRWIEGFDYEFEHFMLGNLGIAYEMLRKIDKRVPMILCLDLFGDAA